MQSNHPETVSDVIIWGDLHIYDLENPDAWISAEKTIHLPEKYGPERDV